MKAVLFGSPAFAVPVLEVLAETVDLVAVVTQPAKPVGRGLKVVQPPLAVRALELGLHLEQPQRVRGNTGFLDWLTSLELDVAVTAAYGKILPASVLEVPREGILNVHASLLPRWRGAAPIQWALIEGDTETGVSIMQTETGVDTGPVRHVRSTAIGPDETAVDLFRRLSLLGAEAIGEALTLLAQGRLPGEPQDDSAASHAPMLVRTDGRVDFSQTALSAYNRYRGVKAWPGSYFPYLNAEVKVHSMKPVHDVTGTPGEVLQIDAGGLLVACGEGALLLGELQSPGKRRLPARDWANGAKVRTGHSLTVQEE